MINLKYKLFLGIIVVCCFICSCSIFSKQALVEQDTNKSNAGSFSVLGLVVDMHVSDTIICFENYYEVYRLIENDSQKDFNYSVERFPYIANNKKDTNFIINRERRFNDICKECAIDYDFYDSSLFNRCKGGEYAHLQHLGAINFMFELKNTQQNITQQNYILFTPEIEDCFWDRNCYSKINLHHIVKDGSLKDCKIKQSMIFANDSNEYINGFTDFNLQFPVFKHPIKNFEIGYFIAEFTKKKDFLIEDKGESVWVNESYTYVILKR